MFGGGGAPRDAGPPPDRTACPRPSVDHLVAPACGLSPRLTACPQRKHIIVGGNLAADARNAFLTIVRVAI